MGTVYKETSPSRCRPGQRSSSARGNGSPSGKTPRARRERHRSPGGRNRPDRITAGTYTAKYRDGSGIVRKVATGCRDKSAARSVLADLESGPKR